MTADLATEDPVPRSESAVTSSGPPDDDKGRSTDSHAAPEAERSALDDEAIVADPGAAGGRRLLGWGAALLAGATLFATLSASGIWEPHELRVADLSRRIALNLLGAGGLSVEGGVNSVPTAGELGRGELPFTIVAGFLRFFGLSEWGGRLPMALFGGIALLATYGLASRLMDRVAGAFAVIVLCTCPLFFLQARTILGDAVTVAGVTLALAGLSLAAFDARLGARARVGWALLGAVGMLVGVGARGAAVGVAIPALSVGLARLIRRGSLAPDRLGAILGVLSFVLGAAALVFTFGAIASSDEQQFSRLLGGTLSPRRQPTTFDAMVLQLGHGLLPWSAIVPFALGRMLLPPVGVAGDAFERESSLRLVVAVAAIVGFGVYGLLAPHMGVWPFGAVAVLAVAVAITFRDLERGAPVSRVLLIGVVAFLVLFYTDYKKFPDKGLSAFAIEEARFPESFKERASLILKLGTVLAGGLFALFLFEREGNQRAFARGEYRGWLRTVRTTHDGNLAFALSAAGLGLAAFAIVVLVSDRFVHWKAIETMSTPLRQLARLGWVIVPGLLLLPLGALLARDLARVLVRKARITRASAALTAVAAFGAAMSFVYYPALARQISPKEVFASFQRLARDGEDLGMTGAGAGSARYYAQRDVRAFGSATEAFTWLSERDDVRRWLILKASDLPQMNSQYRSRKVPAKNLPVLDARSSEILLASNQLREGEVNQNPFAKWVLDERPTPARPLDVDFNGQLRGLGWDVVTRDGEVVPWVRAGKRYVIRFFYEVTRPISGEWQTFIHVDGYQRRYNGDHATLEGKYPFHLWRVGDHIVDTHEFELEPNFSGGTYTVFYGLFRGDQRLAVKRGPAQENRVTAGTLEVR